MGEVGRKTMVGHGRISFCGLAQLSVLTMTPNSPAEGIGDILPEEEAVRIPVEGGLVGSNPEPTCLLLLGLMIGASGT